MVDKIVKNYLLKIKQAYALVNKLVSQKTG